MSPSLVSRLRPISLLRWAVVALTAGGCGGGPGEAQSPAAAGTLECPPPIGSIPRENCADVGDEFGALTVAGALKVAGTGPGSERRIDAIRATGGLANALKEERLELCGQYGACKVAPAQLAARDKVLSDLMNALIKLWNGRQFGDPEGVERFHESVLALHRKLGGKTAPAASASPIAAPPGPPPPRVIAADKLVRLESPALTFRAEPTGVGVTAQDEAPHDALRGTAQVLDLAPPQVGQRPGQRRYQIRVLGAYAPVAPPVVSAGDQLVARVRYRATEPAELSIALRSLEDPDALESTASWKLAANESGAHEAPFTASPGASGFYLGVGARSAGPIDLDDIELLRNGKPIAAARAEVKDEPLVRTACAPSTIRPIAGKRSLRCAPPMTGDLVTLALPPSHLFIALRGATGDKAVLRTLSLEGGRTLDATLSEKADLVIGLAGPGTATIRSVEVTAVPSP